MAEVKNQYGTFQTDKKLGSKRLPSNSDLETKAQKLYGKNFDELTIQQRTQLRTGARGAMSIADDVTFEQYLDDYKNMAGDANYKPKYIKPNLGSGMSTQQKRARAEAKNSIEAFEQKFQKNVNKRKQLKRNANPEKRTQDLASKAERRVTRRIKEKDIALTPREKNINLEQRKLAKEYNAPIRKNPNMVLGNKALMEKLSITISKDGDIIKIPTTLNKKYLSERGLFEIDHQRDIYKKGKGKNLPYNRNLIMGPYNRSGGFKDMAEKFIAANPDSPKIETILKQAEDLKVTLQPDVPTGTFKTKGIGYKQIGDPIEKFKSAINSAQSKLITSTNKLPKADQLKFCSLLSNGGLPGNCKQALKADPEKAAKILSEAPVTSAAMKNVQKDSQKLIRLFRGESFPQRNIKSMKSTAKMFNTTLDEIKKDTLSGQWFSPNQEHALGYSAKPGQLKYVDVTPAELESFNRYKTKINKLDNKYSTKKKLNLPNPPKKSVTDSFHHQIIPRYKLKQMEEASRMKSKLNINPFGKRNIGDMLVKPPKGVLEYNMDIGAFVDAGNPTQKISSAQLKTFAAENPMPVLAGTEDAYKPIKKSMLKTVGRTLAKIGAPLPTALIDGYFVGKQIQDDKSAVEIAKDPLNWLGLATMSTLTKAGGLTKAGTAAPGTMSSILRMGMNPGLIRGVSRFAGLPGLAISTALTAYDQYGKYKNEEGFIYNLFNSKGYREIE